MNQWSKGTAKWRIGNTFYLSVVFSWDVEQAVEDIKAFRKDHKNCKVVVGGPAASLNQEAFAGIAEFRAECEEVEPILFHNPLASWSSRGCPNKCDYCAVPKVEGGIREVWPFRPAPVMCDNNFLATSKVHQRLTMDALRHFATVDFNQGLDARLFTPENAGNLGRLNLHARFAFDHIGMESVVADAVKLCRERTSKTISVYVLIGFKDTPDDARYRLDLVRSWGLRPNPMRYQPLTAKKKNDYIAPGWDKDELRRMMKYYSRLRYYEHIPYDEFRPPAEMLPFTDDKE